MVTNPDAWSNNCLDLKTVSEQEIVVPEYSCWHTSIFTVYRPYYTQFVAVSGNSLISILYNTFSDFLTGYEK